MSLAGVLLVAPLSVTTAIADEIVMPFACAVENGQVRLTPSPENLYVISGTRQEQAMTHCPANTVCQNLQIHRFHILCSGERVPWASVAEASREHGVPLPVGLPQGFAPAGALKARFVLPALAKFSPSKPPLVTTQDLPPGADESYGADNVAEMHAWQTQVRAETWVNPAQGFSGVAIVVGSLLSLLLAACLAASRRVPANVLNYGIAAAWLNGLFEQTHRKSESGEPVELTNALAVVKARIAECELKIAALGAGLLLREVLETETASVRARLLQIESGKCTPQKSAVLVRAMLRDLERIGRIVHGARFDTSPEARAVNADDRDVPQSVLEACRILGVNEDATPQAIKKLVDALRMNWHPDHARDEADRMKREARTKQINAAWDMLKENRRAAA